MGGQDCNTQSAVNKKHQNIRLKTIQKKDKDKEKEGEPDFVKLRN